MAQQERWLDTETISNEKYNLDFDKLGCLTMDCAAICMVRCSPVDVFLSEWPGFENSMF